MNRIVVATDLSGGSDRALQRAFMVASDEGAVLDIINVIDDELAETVSENADQLTRTALNEQIAAIPHAEGVTFETHLIHGEGHAEIVKHSHEAGAELLVLGISRHTTASLFRGTTSERIVRLSTVPTLVVKKPAVSPYRRIVVGIDLSEHSRQALEFVASFAPDAEIYCVHASHEPFVSFLSKETREEFVRDEQKEFTDALTKDIDTIVAATGTRRERFQVLLRTGDARPVLLECVDELKADLLVAGTHGRAAIAYAVLGSVAEELLAEAPTDILVLRAKDRDG